MTKNTKIVPDENRVIYCYGMSKMHVINEKISKQPYDEMRYVEFLEFLGRIAKGLFKDEECSMAEKLCMLLDRLLPQFGMQRKEVEDEEEELSESDPDYWSQFEVNVQRTIYKKKLN